MIHRLAERRVAKPWGRLDLRPPFANESGERIGEIWFEREDDARRDPLLVKYLFTSESLSVQVHPDDKAARSAGHASGKDEAWVVLDAEAGAELGIGLKEPLTAAALREAALDGSIADLLDWRPARRGDVYYSPAGTIHAIGAGLTLLEIQQNSDITYRLYDHGRPRELHLEAAVAAADTGLRVGRAEERGVAPGRSIIASGKKFTVERWSAGAGRLRAGPAEPAWLMPLAGEIRAAGMALEPASAWIAESSVEVAVAERGELLIAYEGAGARF